MSALRCNNIGNSVQMTRKAELVASHGCVGRNCGGGSNVDDDMAPSFLVMTVVAFDAMDGDIILGTVTFAFGCRYNTNCTDVVLCFNVCINDGNESHC